MGTRGMYLSDLTATQLDDVPRERVVIAPLAGFEQHSLHLPFGTDARILDALVAELIKRIPDHLLALPTQWLSNSGQHAPYKGVVSIPSRTYGELLTGVIGSVADAGFSRVLLLNGQYDNDAPLAMALREMRERRSGLSVVACSYWSVIDATEHGEFPGHAGDLETSLMMFLHPDKVVADKRARDGLVPPSKHRQNVMQYARIDQRSHHGGLGDPEAASAERGGRLFDDIASGLVALVRDLHDGLLTG
jgi:creatinine amidohydrolase